MGNAVTRSVMKKPIKILLWCFVAGLVLVFFGLDPLNIWIWLGDTARGLFDLIVSFARWAGPFVLVGAMIVLPIVAIGWFMRRAKSRPSGE
jgi:hypothetical protein